MAYREILKIPNRIIIITLFIPSYGVKIIIANNGMGILKNIKNQLDEVLENPKPSEKVNTLGLSMSHLIVVHKHGGELECNSLSDKGTEFVIKLPSSSQRIIRNNLAIIL